MKKMFRKKEKITDPVEIQTQEFLDMIAPSVCKFYSEYFLCGNTYRCVWAIREYPTSTEDQALLRYLGEKDGITLRIYTRIVSPLEEKKIIGNAANKNRMKQGNTNDLQKSIEAQSNLKDVVELIANMHRSKEPLMHCAVYLELQSQDYDGLKLLQTEVMTELVRSKLNVDRLLLRQQQGFKVVMPSGYDAFHGQFERVLPASSVANLFPFTYSGKTDPDGFYLGCDKFGSNIIVDFNRRTDDKTNANALIIGNSGQGKSYLLKLILCNQREAGMNLICLDPEHEYVDLTKNLGGTFIDLMSGKHIINVLEPKLWASDDEEEEEDVPDTFKQTTLLSQHVSFLKDFFRSYKKLTGEQMDTLELMLMELYERFNITNETDITLLRHEEFPTLKDLYEHMKARYRHFDETKKSLYTERT